LSELNKNRLTAGFCIGKALVPRPKAPCAPVKKVSDFACILRRNIYNKSNAFEALFALKTNVRA
jgi:hypothetical protein